MSTYTPVADNETRARLLKAAARLFAERGFHHVSVREICREAGTNLAAVNYYFRDKLGLYRELIGAVAEGMNTCKTAALETGAGESPEERLRGYIRRFLHHLLDPRPSEDSAMEKVIAREMMEPTPALDLIIEKGIKPAAQRLQGLIGEHLGLPACDPRVVMSAGAIQGLCLWYRSSQTVAEHMFPGLRYTPEVIDAIADFIAGFSLEGMRAASQEKRAHEQGLDALR